MLSLSAHDRPNEKGCPAQVLSVSGHLTPTQGGNLIIGSLNLTADNELKAGAASTCGEMPINDELGSPYFDSTSITSSSSATSRKNFSNLRRPLVPTLPSNSASASSTVFGLASECFTSASSRITRASMT